MFVFIQYRPGVVKGTLSVYYIKNLQCSSQDKRRQGSERCSRKWLLSWRGAGCRTSRLRRRLDMAMTKKMGIVRLPPAFWPADPKINPRADHLFWASLLLLDRQRIDLALAVLAAEQAER